MSIEDGPGDTLSPSESVDPDEVRNDDGDETVDPPEGWSAADKFGTTPREEREGESLDDRLAEEEPDVLAREAADTLPPDSAADPITDLDGLNLPAVDDDSEDEDEDDIGRRPHGSISGSPDDGTAIHPVVE
ncbi:hypothetical protein ACFTZB_43585 [Rhodococcus sp. NPDC057014]|uniref:hypothetical protein n=1 Tax=Rhodococcus sp. NPDC057014 TaxID=3346000 RepID=UPI0036320985